MARFMTYVVLLAIALMAVTCPVSANPDPADVAAEANVENSPEHSTETDEATADTKSPVVHNTGAISDSISKVTIETTITPPTSNSTSNSSSPHDSPPASTPIPAPAASASTLVTPSIALASVAAIVIINLLV